MWSVHYDLSIDTARADALFASALQISDAPSAVQVKQAIDAATRTLGDLGCVARVAQEFGEHPETAVTRMRWARDEVACVFGGSPSDPDYAPRPVRPGGALPANALPANALPARACPAPRLPGDMTGPLPDRHLLLAC
jgi:hypothetical protein